MKNSYTLQLDSDSWYQKIIIGLRLAFNQDELIGVYSNMQHINTLIENKDAFSEDELLKGIQHQVDLGNKVFERFF